MGIEPRLWVLSTCSLAPDACNQTKEFLLAAVVGCSFPLLVSREKTKENSLQGLCALSAGLIFIIVPGTPAEDKRSRAVIRSAASVFWRPGRNICTCCSGFSQECLSAGRVLQKHRTSVNGSMRWSDSKCEAQQQTDRAIGEILWFPIGRRQD